MENTGDKIDLNELIGDYVVENIPAFQTYLRQVWKDLSGRSEDKDKAVIYDMVVIEYDSMGNPIDDIVHYEKIRVDDFIDSSETLAIGPTGSFPAIFGPLVL